MTTKKILDLLESKNQNLPKVDIGSSFKGLSTIYVPVIEGKEKDTYKIFPSAKKEKVKGKKGERKGILKNNQEYVFVGVGPEKNVNYRTMRRFYGSAYLGASGNKPKTIGLYCDLDWLEAGTVGVYVSAIKPDLLKPKKHDASKNTPPNVFLINPDFKAKMAYAKELMKKGTKIAEGKNIMRLLGTIPPNELSTTKYAEVIVALAKKWKVKCQNISKKDLEKYNLLNAVSAGSKHDSQLLVFTIHPKKGKTKKSTALIGKGLCYDSGGLQDKQSHMKFMKEDMAGSASVMGTIYNIVHGNLDVKETTYFLLPLAENMMGAGAMRADDIYITGDGQSVEIVHTDAEGRLILADALCYVKNNFKNVHRFYTIATLTGSCIIALGEHYTGVVCNDEGLADEVSRAGKEAGDYTHAGPWDMDYDDNNSPVADVANLGDNQREAGWVKAGMFLYRFVPKAKKENEQAQFCHFDIAATIDMDEKGKPWRQKGFSSGVGVGLLTKLLTK